MCAAGGVAAAPGRAGPGLAGEEREGAGAVLGCLLLASESELQVRS